MRSAARKSGRPRRKIGGYDSDEGDALKIVAFGDHLRADENVHFPLCECAEDLLEFALGADGIAIEARDIRGGESFAQIFFDALGAVADEIHVFGVAFRALLRRAQRVSAVVAFEALAIFVIREGDAAILALHEGAATAAE